MSEQEWHVEHSLPRRAWWSLCAIWRHRWYLWFYSPRPERRAGVWYQVSPWHVWAASVVVGWPLVVMREIGSFAGPRVWRSRWFRWALDADYRFNSWADNRSTGYAWMRPLNDGYLPGPDYKEVGFHVRDDLLPPRPRDEDGHALSRGAGDRPRMFVACYGDAELAA